MVALPGQGGWGPQTPRSALSPLWHPRQTLAHLAHEGDAGVTSIPGTLLSMAGTSLPLSVGSSHPPTLQRQRMEMD